MSAGSPRHQAARIERVNTSRRPGRAGVEAVHKLRVALFGDEPRDAPGGAALSEFRVT